jgi:hypothetical protein
MSIADTGDDLGDGICIMVKYSVYGIVEVDDKIQYDWVWGIDDEVTLDSLKELARNNSQTLYGRTILVDGNFDVLFRYEACREVASFDD